MPPSKVQAVILQVLAMLGQRVHRTKLVKLIYLADNKFYELNGRTITGLSYMWDNYGPNAVSNAIVKEADRLVSLNKVHMAAQPSVYGTDSYLYWAMKTAAQEGLARLSPGEAQVLRDTVKEFGRKSIQQVVAASKRTKPFRSAKQYETLEFESNSRVTELQKRVTANSEFMSAAQRGLKDIEKGRLISQEELDELYGKQR